MINKINITFKNIERDINNKVERAIDKSTSILLEDVKEKSPVDTWKYIWWHTQEKSKQTWDVIKGSVYNDMEYAKEVEYWFKSTAVNWHKNRRQWWPVIYRWVGARVYTRAYDENKDKITDLINKQVRDAIK